MSKTIVIIGASGGIGSAFVDYYTADNNNTVYALSRSPIKTNSSKVHWFGIDYRDESTIKNAADTCSPDQAIDLVIVATGLLHTEGLMPEKALKDLSIEKFEKLFLVNTIGPALVAKYFLPKLNRKKHSVFSVLSARVGSIYDNRLGGWYAYRSSKAALNMFIKTASIEMARRNPQAIVVGLHPGTVATSLSKPFQKGVPSEKLFTAQHSATKLAEVIKSLNLDDSGKVFAWNGTEIPF